MSKRLIVPAIAAMFAAALIAPVATTHAQIPTSASMGGSSTASTQLSGFPPYHRGQVTHYTLTGVFTLTGTSTTTSDVFDQNGNEFVSFTAPGTFSGDISGSATLTATNVFNSSSSVQPIQDFGGITCPVCTVFDPQVGLSFTGSLAMGVAGEFFGNNNPNGFLGSLFGIHNVSGLPFLDYLHPSGTITDLGNGSFGYTIDLHP